MLHNSAGDACGGARTCKESLDAFDRLPFAVRERLRYADKKWSAVQIEQVLERVKVNPDIVRHLKSDVRKLLKGLL